MIRVYIAAPKQHVARARAAGARLADAPGVEVVSGWHDVYEDGAADPTDVAAARRVLERNRFELEDANLVLALTADGCGRETYVEIGAAEYCGIEIVWSLQHGGGCLSTCYATAHTTDDEAIAAIERMARAGR